MLLHSCYSIFLFFFFFFFSRNYRAKFLMTNTNPNMQCSTDGTEIKQLDKYGVILYKKLKKRELGIGSSVTAAGTHSPSSRQGLCQRYTDGVIS